MHQVYTALTRAVVASPLPEAAWYSAAEAALTALYTLHPSPEHLSAAVLKHLARAAFASQAGGEEEAQGGAPSEQGAAAEEGAAAEAMEADDAEGAPAEEQPAEGEAAEGAEGAAAPAASQQTGATGSQAPRSMHSVATLSRFFFVLGHVALQHLVRPLLGRWVVRIGCIAFSCMAIDCVPPLTVLASQHAGIRPSAQRMACNSPIRRCRLCFCPTGVH